MRLGFFFRESGAKFWKSRVYILQFFISTEVSDSLLKSNDVRSAWNCWNQWKVRSSTSLLELSPDSCPRAERACCRKAQPCLPSTLKHLLLTVAGERILGYVDLWSQIVWPLYCSHASSSRFFASVNVAVPVSWLYSVGDVLPLSRLQHTELGSNTSPVPKHHRGSCTRAGGVLTHWVDLCWALQRTWGISSCEALTNVDTSVLCLLFGGGAGPRIGPSAWDMLSELCVHAKLTHTKKSSKSTVLQMLGNWLYACVKGVTMPNLNTYYIPLWEADDLRA